MGPDEASDAAAAGDDFAAFFAARRREALRLAYLLCGDHNRAEDVVADAFARVYPHFRRGRIADPVAYLQRAVVNGVRGGFRKRLLERREESRRRADDRGALDLVEHLAERDALRHALASLPTRQRAAVVLRHYAGLSEAETAALMGTSIGSVKAQVSRGLARLREALAEPTAERGTS